MSTPATLPHMFALLEALILIEPDLHGPFWALICLSMCGSGELDKMTPVLFFLFQSEKIKSKINSGEGEKRKKRKKRGLKYMWVSSPCLESEPKSGLKQE